MYEKQSNDLFIIPERLIASLKKLLEYYPFLGSVFTKLENDKKIDIEHDDVNGGILFVSTMTNISLHEIPLSNEEYTIDRILPDTLHLLNTVPDPERLFHVCHTRFACGSVALGICLNHRLADGHSYFQLVNDWARLYKDFEYQPSICHKRSLLEPTTEEIQTLQNTNSDFDNRRSHAVKNENIPSPPTVTKEIVVKIFRFSADELRRMKMDATTHLSSGVDYISTFDALTAHLHQHVMLARHHPSSTITRLFIATNIRPRLVQPSLPSTYFGNAIMFSYLEVPISDITHMALASQIHRAIQDNDNNDIRTTLAWVLCQNDHTKITPTFDLNGTDFTISAWNKMRMYSDADFESETRPYRILLPPETKFNGTAILLSTEMNDESLDLVLGLDVNEMERVENNPDFRKYRREE